MPVHILLGEGAGWYGRSYRGGPTFVKTPRKGKLFVSTPRPPPDQGLGVCWGIFDWGAVV